MSDELKACPFCGESDDGRITVYKGHSGATVKCMTCFAQGTTLDVWNTRATDARLAEAERLLREALDFACPSGETPTSDLACRIDAFLTNNG